MGDELGLTATPYSGSGSTDRLVVLADHQIDLAILSDETIMRAFRGEGAFADQGRIPVRVLGGIQVATIQLVTWKGSGIESAADLKGKTFMYDFVTAPQITAAGNRLLEANGLTADDVTALKYSTTNDAMNALREHTADAVLHPGSIAGSACYREIELQTDLVFISLTDEECAFIVENEPYLKSGLVVPAGTYKNQDQDCHTVGFYNTMIAMDDTNYDFVYKTMKILFDDVGPDTPGRFVNYHADAGAFTLNFTLDEIGSAPFHDAAVQYFKDRGVWTDEMESIQQTLLAEEAAAK